MYCIVSAKKPDQRLVDPFLKRKIWRCFFQSLSLLPNQYVYILQKQCVLFGYREIDRVCLCVYSVQKSVFGFAKRLSSYLDRLFAQKEIALFAPSIPVYSIYRALLVQGEGDSKVVVTPQLLKKKKTDPKKGTSQKYKPKNTLNFWPSHLRVLNIYDAAPFCI